MNACPPKLNPRVRPALSRVAASRPAPMETEPNADETMRLRDGELWALDPTGRPLHVRCLAGNIWITQQGRADDIVLTAGGLCVVPGDGKLVVQALDDAVVRIEH
jgi:hypothetical protein